MENKIILSVAKLKDDASKSGYKINDDEVLVYDLVSGIEINKARYNIESCPCRLYEGEREDNLDIICPCVYRDDDLNDYGTCFCGLYVNEGVKFKQPPDRRPLHIDRVKDDRQIAEKDVNALFNGLKYPIFRCTVCGYLCANNNPPNLCPICKAKKDRFEKFI